MVRTSVTGEAPVRYRSMVADSARLADFEFRDGDIVISTPPKCGTTWTQMICALLIFQAPDLPDKLALLSPWVEMSTRPLDSVLADLAAQEHRRFIKSHTAFDGLPFDDRVTYLCVGRDPRDVGLSWDGHMNNLDLNAFIGARAAAVGLDDLAELMPEGGIPQRRPTPVENFRIWVEEPAPAGLSPVGTLQATMHHLATFWAERSRPNVILLRYEDLQADLEGEMRQLAERLSIGVPEDRWPALARAATFDEMRANADTVVPDSTNHIWQSNAQFFRSGTSGQWRSVLADEDQARYLERVGELAPPDLLAWVHGEA